MGFNCGIVGLPNVGKSTLFNALTDTAAADAANYPFCTIEPNIGRVAVPDARLAEIAALSKPEKVVPTQIEFVDIAGLVKGASQGEGLGNQFLAQIRETDAIAHLIRCFEGGEVTHVDGRIDPIADADVVDTELMLADLQGLERRLDLATKRARGGDKDALAILPLMEKMAAALGEGRPARAVSLDGDERSQVKTLRLLTAKPIMYVCNVDEDSAATGNRFSQMVEERARAEDAACVVISAAIEAEIAQLGEAEEKRAFLESLGLAEAGLDRLIRAGYRLLDLITFFTTGPKETHAWTVPRGTTAARAAGQIHTDFERGFICAETVSVDDFIAHGGEQAARDAGKMRQEGRDYVVQDGDIMLIRFNV